MKLTFFLRIGRKTNNKTLKKSINWFVRRYYACEIDCSTTISDTAKFPHNGFCVMINPNCVIGDNVSIFPGAKLVATKSALNVPIVEENVIIGANATIIGNIKIGANSIVGAGAVVSKDVPGGSTVVGINQIYPSKSETSFILHQNN